MIPIAVFAGRQILLPVFDDFGVELPASTRYLLSPYAPALLLIVYLMVLVLVFAGEDGTSRRRLSWIALTLGIIVVTACVLSILTPLLSLWRDLS